VNNDTFNIIGLFKARPSEEDGKRYLYIEASKEDVDQENEVVLCDALRKSAEYFLASGNVDIDHISQIKPKNIENPYAYEIGKPIEVKCSDDGVTYVKSEIYQGKGPASKMAEFFWDSITNTIPPATWYASVAGEITDRGKKILDDGSQVSLVKGVRWTNVALSKTPVLRTLNPASITPIGSFAKSEFAKALEIGFETDSAQIEGAQSLVEQSLDTSIKSTVAMTYEEFKSRLLEDISNNKVIPDIESLLLYSTNELNLELSQGQNFVALFLIDLSLDSRSNLRGSPMSDITKSSPDTVELDTIVKSEGLEAHDDEVEDRKLIEEIVEEVVEEKLDEALNVEKSDDDSEGTTEGESEDKDDVNEDAESDEEIEKSDEVEPDKFDILLSAIKDLSDMIGELKSSLSNNDTAMKSLTSRVEVLSKTPTGRRSVSMTTKTASLDPSDILNKCLALQAANKITGTDTIIIDSSVKQGLGIPEQFVKFFN
jgi:hypothetical protein